MISYKDFKYCFITAIVAVFFSTGDIYAYALNEYKAALDSPEIDLIFPIDNTYDPTQNGGGQIDFEDPLNIHNEVEYDPVSGEYIFSSFIGDSLIYRYSSSMTLEEYIKFQSNTSLNEFWQNKMDEQT